MVECATKAKIEAHIRKHRASGGKAESPKEGRDEAEMDIKDKPNRRNAAPKIEDAAEEMKAKKGGRVKRKFGGKMKEVEAAEGERAHHHAGRRHRASGGGCEANPFTSALKGSNASGRVTQHESKGTDH